MKLALTSQYSTLRITREKQIMQVDDIIQHIAPHMHVRAKKSAAQVVGKSLQNKDMREGGLRMEENKKVHPFRFRKRGEVPIYITS